MLIRKHTLSKGAKESIIQLNQAFAWKTGSFRDIDYSVMLGRPARSQQEALVHKDVVLSCFHYEGFPILTMLFQLPRSFHLKQEPLQAGGRYRGLCLLISDTFVPHNQAREHPHNPAGTKMLILFRNLISLFIQWGVAEMETHSWICDNALRICQALEIQLGHRSSIRHSWPTF